MGTCGLVHREPEGADSSSPTHQGVGNLGCSLEWAFQSWGGATCYEKGQMALGGTVQEVKPLQEFLTMRGLILIFIQNLKMLPNTEAAKGAGAPFHLSCLCLDLSQDLLPLHPKEA